MPADDAQSVFDRLVGQDARVRRLLPMATDGPLTAGDIARIRAELEARMAERQLSQSDLAEAIGSTATYVNNLLRSASSLPERTRDDLWRAVRNWLERELRAEERERPKGFVRTTVAERLIAIIEDLAVRSDMAVAYGPAGIGKTETVQALLADHPDAVLVRAGRINRTPARVLQCIGRALTRRRSETRITYEMVVDRLRKPDKVKVRSLVIVDEAHELPPKSLRLLRDLYDEARCSVLLIGTVDVKRMVASDADAEYGQLSSRVGMRVNLAPELTGHRRGGCPLIRISDIRQIYDRAKIRLHPAAARLLTDLANTPGLGALRRVERLYDLALRAATRGGAAAITVDHVAAAQRLVEEEWDLRPEASGAETEREAVTA